VWSLADSDTDLGHLLDRKCGQLADSDTSDSTLRLITYLVIVGII